MGENIDSNNNQVGGYQRDYEDIHHSRYDWFRKRKATPIVKDWNKIIIKPISENPWVFTIPANPKKWTDIQTLRLHGRVKIVNKTKNAAPARTENFSTVNNLFHSIFSSVQIRVNDVPFDDTSLGLYPFKAYFEVWMNTPDDFKRNQMEPINAWHYDSVGGTSTSLNEFQWAGEGDTENPNAAKYYEEETVDMTDAAGTKETVKLKRKKMIKTPGYNAGYVKRREGISAGSWNYFSIALKHDIYTSEVELIYLFLKSMEINLNSFLVCL